MLSFIVPQLHWSVTNVSVCNACITCTFTVHLLYVYYVYNHIYIHACIYMHMLYACIYYIVYTVRSF